MFVFCSLVLALFFALRLEASSGIDTTERSGVTVVPFATYTPETSVALGVSGIYYFRWDSQPFEQRPSNISGGIIYTLENQKTIVTNYDLYFNNLRWRWYGRSDYEVYPLNFWGIGDNTSAAMKESYTPEAFRFNSYFLRNIVQSEQGQGLNLGIRYGFRTDHIQKRKVGGQLDSGNVIGKDGGVISGFGGIISWDSRDNIFASGSGSFLELVAIYYNSIFGSEYNIDRYWLDGRWFHSWSEGQTLALQLFLANTIGNTPFYFLNLFGGDKAMRGHFQGRYRDQAMAYAQAEYRFPIWWRVSAVSFCGLGDVATSLGRLSMQNIKYSIGLGLRFALAPAERLNLRLDVGRANTTWQYYVTIAEAF